MDELEARVAQLEIMVSAAGQAILQLEDAVWMNERLLNCILHYHPEALETLRKIMDNETLLTTTATDDQIRHFERFWHSLSLSLAQREQAVAAEGQGA